MGYSANAKNVAIEGVKQIIETAADADLSLRYADFAPVMDDRGATACRGIAVALAKAGYIKIRHSQHPGGISSFSVDGINWTSQSNDRYTTDEDSVRPSGEWPSVDYSAENLTLRSRSMKSANTGH